MRRRLRHSRDFLTGQVPTRPRMATELRDALSERRGILQGMIAESWASCGTDGREGRPCCVHVVSEAGATQNYGLRITFRFFCCHCDHVAFGSRSVPEIPEPDTLEHGSNARGARRALAADLVLVEDILDRRPDGHWELTTIRRHGTSIQRTVKLAGPEDRRRFGIER